MTTTPVQRSFTDAQKVQITFHHWPIEKPKAVVQLVHGLGEHARRYDHVASALNAHGYEVYATDHRGHGQTGVQMRAAGLIKKQGNLGPGGMKAVFADEVQLTQLINAEHPGLAVMLIGHSWGSMIAQRVLDTNSNLYRAVVLTGSTKLWVGMPSAGFNKKWDKEPGANGKEWLSRDKSVGQNFIADPLNFPEAAMQVFGVANSLALMGSPKPSTRDDLPVLLQVGSEDPIGGEKGNEALLKGYLAAGVKDVQLMVYHGARHEVFNETNQHDVIADTITWLDGEL
ncbi:MAG: alpha/beta fold hydrolase [Micrococcales bacterium]